MVLRGATGKDEAGRPLDRLLGRRRRPLMPFEYVSVEEAIARRGWRMVVVGGIPSRWGGGAKGILHTRDSAWTAVRLVYDSEPLKDWAGQRSGPVAIYDDDKPRAGWAEILLLGEPLPPAPRRSRPR